MTPTVFLVYVLILAYFGIERGLRKGAAARSLKAGAADRGSSRLLWVGGLFNLGLILAAPVLNGYQVGVWNHPPLAWMGILLMLGGLGMRFWAAQTLGRFYTRTLQTLEGQQIIDRGPYRMLRHPGYLGVWLLDLGAGLAIGNWVVLLLVASTGLLTRLYRIQVEEGMLRSAFGEQYRVYADKTWRLIPFVY